MPSASSSGNQDQRISLPSFKEAKGEEPLLNPVPKPPFPCEKSPASRENHEVNVEDATQIQAPPSMASIGEEYEKQRQLVLPEPVASSRASYLESKKSKKSIFGREDQSKTEAVPGAFGTPPQRVWAHRFRRKIAKENKATAVRVTDARQEKILENTIANSDSLGGTNTQFSRAAAGAALASERRAKLEAAKKTSPQQNRLLPGQDGEQFASAAAGSAPTLGKRGFLKRNLGEKARVAKAGLISFKFPPPRGSTSFSRAAIGAALATGRTIEKKKAKEVSLPQPVIFLPPSGTTSFSREAAGAALAAGQTREKTEAEEAPLTRPTMCPPSLGNTSPFSKAAAGAALASNRKRSAAERSKTNDRFTVRPAGLLVDASGRTKGRRLFVQIHSPLPWQPEAEQEPSTLYTRPQHRSTGGATNVAQGRSTDTTSTQVTHDSSRFNSSTRPMTTIHEQEEKQSDDGLSSENGSSSIQMANYERIDGEDIENPSTEEVDNATTTTSSAMAPSLEDEPLAVASPVDDPPSRRDLMEAEPVDLEAATERNRKFLRRMGTAFLTGLVFVVAAALLVTYIVGGFDAPVDREDSVQTSAPTTQPTQAPTTMVPTSPWSLLVNPSSATISALNVPGSPQSLAYQWLEDYPGVVDLPMWRKEQLFALVSIYHSLNGENWPLEPGRDWKHVDRHECDWWSDAFIEYSQICDPTCRYIPVGTTNDTICDLDGRYLHLGLTNIEGLDGTLPAEVTLLQSLEVISLRGHDLSGSPSFLPLAVARLQQLPHLQYIRFGSNRIVGTVPSRLGYCPSLKELDLSGNDLNGTIPMDLLELSLLETLSFWSNVLTGTIATEFGLLTVLKELDLGLNSLSGTLPSELAELTSLQRLIITSAMACCRPVFQNLTGTIPSEYGALTMLQEFDLSGCDFSGELPSEIGRMVSMRNFSLTGNSLTGGLPSEIWHMSLLERFDLRSNELNSTITSLIGLLSSLVYLGLSWNDLRGSIPSEVGLLTRLTNLELRINDLSGTIPPEIGAITLLEDDLDLQRCDLTGTIPSEVGRLTQIAVLWLSNNDLEGTIPSEVGLLTALTGLRLQNNPCLQGTIPTELGLLTNLWDAELWGLSLSGTVPSELCAVESVDIWVTCIGLSCHSECEYCNCDRRPKKNCSRLQE
jgi:Leucine-rich repeat (LRR) protein